MFLFLDTTFSDAIIVLSDGSTVTGNTNIVLSNSVVILEGSHIHVNGCIEVTNSSFIVNVDHYQSVDNQVTLLTSNCLNGVPNITFIGNIDSCDNQRVSNNGGTLLLIFEPGVNCQNKEEEDAFDMLIIVVVAIIAVIILSIVILTLFVSPVRQVLFPNRTQEVVITEEKGYNTINEKLNKLESEMNEVEERCDKVNKAMDDLEKE